MVTHYCPTQPCPICYPPQPPCFGRVYGYSDDAHTINVLLDRIHAARVSLDEAVKCNNLAAAKIDMFRALLREVWEKQICHPALQDRIEEALK